MASTTPTVLVFGPTGGVGRAAALAASKHGAKVWLAMRDTTKTIQGLDESSSTFSRVQADLSDPSSLTAAVEKSGATAAFVYVLHTAEDHMAASFKALKDAGVKYVVLLSSYSVRSPASDESNMKNFISKAHALAEIALEKSGLESTALRPAYFNTNVLWNVAGIKAGEVSIFCPDTIFDFIAPEDIGATAGALLVAGKGTEPVPLNGPKLYKQGEAYVEIGKVLGKEIKVTEIGEEEFLKRNSFLPEPIVKSLVSGFKEGGMFDSEENWKEAVENIKKYGRIEPTTFVDWVQSHKAAFAS